MTFLQQTLGKNYKWIYIFKYYFKYDFMLGNAIWHWIAGNLFHSFSFVFLWSYVVKNNDFAIYALIGSIFTRATGSWINWSIGNDIRTGKISKYLMSTTNFFNLFFVVSFAKPLFESLIILAITSIIGTLFFGLKLSLELILICIPFVLIGSFINYSFNCLSGFIAFWEENFNSFINTFQGIIPVFSGGFIPLIALPFYEYLKFNPFAYFVHIPTQIYLGKYSITEIIYTFLGGIAWCVVLWLLARVIFKLGLKKNEAVGL
jgi:ABC-2 type transport system permease protein